MTPVVLLAAGVALTVAASDAKGAPTSPSAPAVKSGNGPASGGGNLPPGYDPETGIRSYAQHAFTKIRQGSMLKSDVPDMPLQLPELRGGLAVRRDMEVIKHFTRLAELDVIAQMAAEGDDMVLAERSEEVRRKETQRFNGVMQALREQVWHQQVAQTP